MFTLSQQHEIDPLRTSYTFLLQVAEIEINTFGRFETPKIQPCRALVCVSPDLTPNVSYDVILYL
jgi:hypothetical protein